MKGLKKVLSILICFAMVLPMFCFSAFAADNTNSKTEFVKAYVDRVIKGKDGELYDFLPNGFNVYSQNPVTWVRKNGEITTPSSIMNQQYFFRLLDGLTELTGDTSYKNYAVNQYKNYMNNASLHDNNGLFYSGNHRYYDITSGKIIGDVTNSYELKFNFPYYKLMFEADSEKAADFVEAYWNAMVSDWENLLFSRHGSFNKTIASDVWASGTYNKEHELWLKNDSSGLSFINAGTDLIYAAVEYYKATGHKPALQWAKNLWNEYYMASDKNTKILVYQYTQLASGDRGKLQFGETYGDRALEGKILTKSYASAIYGIAVPALVQIASEINDTEWLNQLKESYEGFIDYAYNTETGKFRPILSDGTSLVGYTADVDGYFFKKGESPSEYAFTTDLKTGLLYVATVTDSEKLWNIARNKYSALGEIGTKPGVDVSLRLTTTNADPQHALVFLKLYDKTKEESYLKLALKICDNMKKYCYSNGYFLNPTTNANNNEYINASVNEIAPLVMLKAAAYEMGKPDAIPDFPVAVGGYLDDYSGETGDRTTDEGFTYMQKKSDVTSKVVNVATGESYKLPASINGHKVDWMTDSDTADTSKAGTFTYYGTSEDNINCVLIVNVAGYNYYEDFEDFTAGSVISTSGRDVFRTNSTGAASGVLKYNYTDSSKENQALSIEAIESQASYVTYNTFSQAYTGKDVEIGYKMKIDGTGSARVRLATSTLLIPTVNASARQHNFLQVVADRDENGYTVSYYNFYNKSIRPIANANTTHTSDWLDVKIKLNFDAKSYEVYINGEKTLSDSTDPEGHGFANVETAYFLSDGLGEGSVAYLDDFCVKSSLSSNAEGILKLENSGATGTYAFEVEQGEKVPPQNFTYKLINSKGEDTGLTVDVPVDFGVDTTYVGTFNREANVGGKTIPYTVTVNKLVSLIYDNFQEYEDDVVEANSRPYYEPYNANYSRTTDKVVFDGNNKVVKITGESGKATRFYSGANASSRKFEYSYSVKLDESIKDNFTGTSTAFVNLKNSAGKQVGLFTISIKKDTDGSLYVGMNGTGAKYKAGIDFGEWITISGVVDFDSDRSDYGGYTVCCNGTELVERPLSNTAEPGPIELRFTEEFTGNGIEYLIDDIELNNYLKVKELKEASAKIYLGDEPKLPSEVTTVLTDGVTRSTLPVKWNGTVSSDTVGSQKIAGSVIGSDGYSPVLNVEVTNLPYEIDNILVHNKDGYTVMSLASGSVVKSVDVKKISNDTFASKIVVGLFDETNGKLIQVKTCNIDSSNSDWEKDEIRSFDINMNVAIPEGVNPENCNVRAFVVDSKLKPLSEKTSLSNAIDSATIWLTGDSQMCEYGANLKPETGWGEKLAEQFNNVTVYNEALGGQSTKSFYDQGRLQKILANSNPGDYLFIMFGLNDDKPEEYRRAEANTTYKEYLRKFVNEAREYGMIPVLLTSGERYTAFKDEFTVVSTTGDYPEATRAVAKELNVPLVDVHSRVIANMERLGKTEYQKYYMVFEAGLYPNYPNGSGDRSHYREEGAELIASFVLEGIKEINLPLASLVK